MRHINYLKAKKSNIGGSRKVTENQSIIIIGSTSPLLSIVIFYFGICRTVPPKTYSDNAHCSGQYLECSRFTPALLHDEKAHLSTLLLLSLSSLIYQSSMNFSKNWYPEKASPLGLVSRVLEHGSGSSQEAEHHHFVAFLLHEPHFLLQTSWFYFYSSVLKFI